MENNKKDGNYKESSTSFIEKKASEDLSRILGEKVLQNNLKNITDIDLKTENDVTIDVQYSNNFAKYGDVRVDVVSAYIQNNQECQKRTTHEGNNKVVSKKEELINTVAERLKGMKILKFGKVLDDNSPDILCYYFYDEKLKEMKDPDKILITSSDSLVSYICNQSKNKIDIKINNKQGLNDKHGSAFIPVNCKDLAENIDDAVFCDYKDLDKNKEKINKLYENIKDKKANNTEKENNQEDKGN